MFLCGSDFHFLNPEHRKHKPGIVPCRARRGQTQKGQTARLAIISKRSGAGPKYRTGQHVVSVNVASVSSKRDGVSLETIDARSRPNPRPRRAFPS
jgi:hypothetical protein